MEPLWYPHNDGITLGMLALRSPLPRRARFSAMRGVHLHRAASGVQEPLPHLFVQQIVLLVCTRCACFAKSMMMMNSQ